jgi:hypothetical protein
MGCDSPPPRVKRSRARATTRRVKDGAERSGFPSTRQAKAPGLRREFYPAYLRELVDYDYDGQLPESARVWLAAFTEEHYRGWRLSAETQLHSLTQIREAGAEHQRRRRRQDPLSFAQHREEQRSPTTTSTSELLEVELAMRMAAAELDMEPHELRARNHTEDELIDRLDAARPRDQVKARKRRPPRR